MGKNRKDAPILPIKAKHKDSFSKTKSLVASGTLATLLLMSVVAAVLGPIGGSSQPAWAGTFPGINGEIAFVSDRDGNDEIYVMNAADGSGQIRLTNNAADDREPSWSSDGTKIAFSSQRDGPNNEIYVMNAADGSSQTRLTNNDAIDQFPSFSPDGTKIAFARSDSDGTEIYVMNAADGSSQTRLTDSSGLNWRPSWSPDGTKIAFESTRDGTYEIYVMNAADGSGQTRLTNNNDFNFTPSFSPDGTKIAFIRGVNNTEIYVMNAADGSGQKRLTNNDSTDDKPSFSPDGTKIAFVSYKDGKGEIYVMNAADGSSQTRLTNNAADDSHPDWGVKSPVRRATLTVNSVDLSGNPVNGMWTVIRQVSDGTVLKTGFTPLTFRGISGVDYKISVANYDSKVFDHWENGSKSRTRTVTLTSGDTAAATTTITASFDTGDSLRGFTPLTYTGTKEQPDLTVNAISIDEGGRSLHMWTIIDPQSSNSPGTATTYKVYASNYGNKVFDHWEDGSTDRVRTLTISKDTTITAHYMTEIEVQFVYKDCGLSSAGCGLGTITCADGTTEGPGPISLAFFLTVTKTFGNPVRGDWLAVIPGAAGPSGAAGTLSTLSFDGVNFKSEGDLSAGAICPSDPAGNFEVSFSGQCGGTEVRFEATNGVRATIEGDVTCTTPRH